MRVAIVFLVMLSACSAGPTIRASCTGSVNGKVAACLDLTGTDTSGFNNLCLKQGGEMKSSPCPTTSRTGSCLQSKGTTLETILRSYDPVSTETAKSICQMGAGEFTPN